MANFPPSIPDQSATGAGNTGFAFERDIEDLFVRDCLAIFLGVGSVHDSSYGRLRNAAISLRATEL